MENLGNALHEACGWYDLGTRYSSTVRYCTNMYHGQKPPLDFFASARTRLHFKEPRSSRTEAFEVEAGRQYYVHLKLVSANETYEQSVAHPEVSHQNVAPFHAVSGAGRFCEAETTQFR